MKTPIVSVILPIKDDQDFLKDCIVSLKKQNFRKFEVIAIDDASRDGSWLTLRKAKGKDKRFRIYKNKARYGLRITLIRAIKKAKGDYIVFMSPNSLNYQRRLKTQLRFLENNPKIAAVGAQAKYIDFKNKLLSKSFFPSEPADISKQLLSGQAVEPWSLMINRKLLPKDIFKLDITKPSLIFTNLLLKIDKYSQISNLEAPLLYVRRMNNKTKLYALIDHYTELAKLLLRTLPKTNQRPSFKALLSPLLSEI